MVPLHLGFHESVPVHFADHPAGDPAGGRRALSGGDTGPAQVTLCLMLALGIVSPLMSATAFINSMKSMQFAVKDTRELLNLPQLVASGAECPSGRQQHPDAGCIFSYGGTEGKEVLRHLNLTIPQENSPPWWGRQAAESPPSPG